MTARAFQKIAEGLGEALAAAPLRHWSDCAVHNEPAFPAGPCNCGGDAPAADAPRLTAAQQRALAWLPGDGSERPEREADEDTDLSGLLRATPYAERLCEAVMVTVDGRSRIFWRITPAGLALKAGSGAP